VAALALAAAATTAAASATSYGVMAWGINDFGQLGNGSTHFSNVPLTLSAPGEVKAVSGGGEFSLALLNDGKVVAWGSNSEGQLGVGSKGGQLETPLEVKGLSGVTAISAGSSESLALLEDGKVMAWGKNQFGQLGDGKTEDSDEPVEVKGLSEVVAISAGLGYSLALLKDGKVMAWGGNETGELGDGTSKGPEECHDKRGTAEIEVSCSTTPLEVKGLTERVTAISAGAAALALLEGGTVMAWGANGSGELGDGSMGGPEKCQTIKENGEEFEAPCSANPVDVKGLSKVTAVSSRIAAMALLEDSKVMAWGFNMQGQLGDSSSGPEDCRKEPAEGRFKIPCSRTPVEVKGLTEVTAISAGYLHALALLKSGRLEAWGGNTWGQLGVRGGSSETCGLPLGTSEFDFTLVECSRTPVEVSELNQAAVVGISAGGEFSLAVGPPGPIVTSVSPESGSPGGGTEVTIRGSNFTGATAVRFGSASASKVVVNEAGTAITAVSPAGSGKVHVTVTTPSGTIATSSAAGSGSKFKYTATSAPEFGRCFKVAKGTGRYSGGCTAEKAGGSFEWAPGAASRFTLAGEAGGEEATLETVGEAKVVCKTESGAGEYRGTKAVANTVIKFTGCAHAGSKCTTVGAAEGEVVASSLEGELGWINQETKSVGLALFPAGEVGSFAEFRCGSTSVVVRGSVIAPWKILNTMQSTATVKFTATKGKQNKEAFEGEPKDVLEMSFAEGPFSQTGLTVTLAQGNEEPVEVNASI